MSSQHDRCEIDSSSARGSWANLLRMGIRYILTKKGKKALRTTYLVG